MIAAAAHTPTIARYRVERLIGEGGFGQVWRATRDDGTPVAIKLLHLELVRSLDAQTRFERELSAIMRLRHRHIVRALDHGVLSEGRPYLVLEFIEGPSLRDVIHQRRALQPREVLAILEPVCDALATAHAHGLVHRDVKASNVVLGRDAQGPRPVLLDFGLVKLLDDSGPSLTSSRSMLGTPSAMAPEQMRGEPVDARTDVYSLGMLAYHMLTGVVAFVGVQAYLQAHGQCPPPSSHVDVDPAIDAPIVRAVALDPAKRFASARAFVEALHAAIAATDQATNELDVVALYVEGGPAELARAASVASVCGMTIALTAADKLLAVGPPAATNAREIANKLHDVVGAGARVAFGASRAKICGNVVDGDVLEVARWAPDPLPEGMWIADGLHRD
jgi:serine/threonine protein kinase